MATIEEQRERHLKRAVLKELQGKDYPCPRCGRRDLRLLKRGDSNEDWLTYECQNPDCYKQFQVTLAEVWKAGRTELQRNRSVEGGQDGTATKQED